MSASDPRTELAELTAGLSAWARRLRARGRRRLAPGPEELEAVTLTPAQAPQEPRQTEPEAELAPARRPPAEERPPARPTAAVAAAAPDLAALEAAVATCRACGLCETRNRTVFADGRPSARVMFVGEAPGAEEDRQGTPFVGRAGQLLSDIITKGMGLRRPEDVYVSNLLKCRPPDNRDPEPGEKERCTPFLRRQIELVDPEVIVPLGRHAAQHLLASDAPMGRLRGRVHRLDGRAVVPTYHPAYLLRSPNMKPAAWADIQLAMAELGLEIPRTGRSRRPEQG